MENIQRYNSLQRRILRKMLNSTYGTFSTFNKITTKISDDRKNMIYKRFLNKI